MSEFDVNGRIRYTDEGATVTIDKTAKALDGQATAATKAGDATKAASVNVGQFGSTVGLAGAAIGKLNPALGGTVSMAGAALGSIQALTTAGMGPLGIAVAGISLALTAGTAIYARITAAQEAAREKSEELTLALRRNIEALDDLIAKRNQDIGDASRYARVMLGAGSVDEARAMLTRRTTELAAAEAALRAPLESSLSVDAQRTQRAIDLEVAQRNLAAATRGLAEANTTASRAAGASTGPTSTLALENETPSQKSARLAAEREAEAAARAGGAAAARRRAEAEAQAAEDASGREADAAARLALLIEDMDAEAAVRDAMREREISESNAAKDQAIEIERARVAGVKAALDAETAMRAKTAKTQDQILSATGQAHTLLASVIEASAGSSEKSQKAKTQALAAASMIQSGIEMAVEIARVAQSYPDPVGMATHAIGAANFAVAIGVAAAAAGGGGSAPPSGSASVPAASSPGGGPSGPPAGAQEPGGNVYNITLGGGGVVYAADRNELMRTIADGVRAADTRRGR